MNVESAAKQEIHSLMRDLQKHYEIPPCSDLAAYLTILETSGLVSTEQAQEIQKYYNN